MLPFSDACGVHEKNVLQGFNTVVWASWFAQQSILFQSGRYMIEKAGA